MAVTSTDILEVEIQPSIDDAKWASVSTELKDRAVSMSNEISGEISAYASDASLAPVFDVIGEPMRNFASGLTSVIDQLNKLSNDIPSTLGGDELNAKVKQLASIQQWLYQGKAYMDTAFNSGRGNQSHQNVSSLNTSIDQAILSRLNKYIPDIKMLANANPNSNISHRLAMGQISPVYMGIERQMEAEFGKAGKDALSTFWRSAGKVLMNPRGTTEYRNLFKNFRQEDTRTADDFLPAFARGLGGDSSKIADLFGKNASNQTLSNNFARNMASLMQSNEIYHAAAKAGVVSRNGNFNNVNSAQIIALAKELYNGYVRTLSGSTDSARLDPYAPKDETEARLIRSRAAGAKAQSYLDGLSFIDTLMSENNTLISYQQQAGKTGADAFGIFGGGKYHTKVTPAKPLGDKYEIDEIDFRKLTSGNPVRRNNASKRVTLDESDATRLISKYGSTLNNGDYTDAIVRVSIPDYNENSEKDQAFVKQLASDKGYEINGKKYRMIYQKREDGGPRFTMMRDDVREQVASGWAKDLEKSLLANPETETMYNEGKTIYGTGKKADEIAALSPRERALYTLYDSVANKRLWTSFSDTSLEGPLSGKARVKTMDTSTKIFSPSVANEQNTGNVRVAVVPPEFIGMHNGVNYGDSTLIKEDSQARFMNGIGKGVVMEMRGGVGKTLGTKGPVMVGDQYGRNKRDISGANFLVTPDSLKSAGLDIISEGITPAEMDALATVLVQNSSINLMTRAIDKKTRTHDIGTQAMGFSKPTAEMMATNAAYLKSLPELVTSPDRILDEVFRSDKGDELGKIGFSLQEAAAIENTKESTDKYLAWANSDEVQGRVRAYVKSVQQKARAGVFVAPGDLQNFKTPGSIKSRLVGTSLSIAAIHGLDPYRGRIKDPYASDYLDNVAYAEKYFPELFEDAKASLGENGMGLTKEEKDKMVADALLMDNGYTWDESGAGGEKNAFNLFGTLDRTKYVDFDEQMRRRSMSNVELLRTYRPEMLKDAMSAIGKTGLGKDLWQEVRSKYQGLSKKEAQEAFVADLFLGDDVVWDAQTNQPRVGLHRSPSAEGDNAMAYNAAYILRGMKTTKGNNYVDLFHNTLGLSTNLYGDTGGSDEDGDTIDVAIGEYAKMIEQGLSQSEAIRAVMTKVFTKEQMEVRKEKLKENAPNSTEEEVLNAVNRDVKAQMMMGVASGLSSRMAQFGITAEDLESGDIEKKAQVLAMTKAGEAYTNATTTRKTGEAFGLSREEWAAYNSGAEYEKAATRINEALNATITTATEMIKDENGNGQRVLKDGYWQASNGRYLNTKALKFLDIDRTNLPSVYTVGTLANMLSLDPSAADPEDLTTLQEYYLGSGKGSLGFDSAVGDESKKFLSMKRNLMLEFASGHLTASFIDDKLSELKTQRNAAEKELIEYVNKNSDRDGRGNLLQTINGVNRKKFMNDKMREWGFNIVDNADIFGYTQKNLTDMLNKPGFLDKDQQIMLSAMAQDMGNREWAETFDHAASLPVGAATAAVPTGTVGSAPTASNSQQTMPLPPKRKNRFTAHQGSVLMGYSNWSTPLQTLAEKYGWREPARIEGSASDLAQKAGNYLESEIIDFYGRTQLGQGETVGDIVDVYGNDRQKQLTGKERKKAEEEIIRNGGRNVFEGGKTLANTVNGDVTFPIDSLFSGRWDAVVKNAAGQISKFAEIKTVSEKVWNQMFGPNGGGEMFDPKTGAQWDHVIQAALYSSMAGFDGFDLVYRQVKDAEKEEIAKEYKDPNHKAAIEATDDMNTKVIHYGMDTLIPLKDTNGEFVRDANGSIKQIAAKDLMQEVIARNASLNQGTFIPGFDSSKGTDTTRNEIAAAKYLTDLLGISIPGYLPLTNMQGLNQNAVSTATKMGIASGDSDAIIQGFIGALDTNMMKQEEREALGAAGKSLIKKASNFNANMQKKIRYNTDEPFAHKFFRSSQFEVDEANAQLKLFTEDEHIKSVLETLRAQGSASGLETLLNQMTESVANMAANRIESGIAQTRSAVENAVKQIEQTAKGKDGAEGQRAALEQINNSAKNAQEWIDGLNEEAMKATLATTPEKAKQLQDEAKVQQDALDAAKPRLDEARAKIVGQGIDSIEEAIGKQTQSPQELAEKKIQELAGKAYGQGNFLMEAYKENGISEDLFKQGMNRLFGIDWGGLAEEDRSKLLSGKTRLEDMFDGSTGGVLGTIQGQYRDELFGKIASGRQARLRNANKTLRTNEARLTKKSMTPEELAEENRYLEQERIRDSLEQYRNTFGLSKDPEEQAQYIYLVRRLLGDNADEMLAERVISGQATDEELAGLGGQYGMIDNYVEQMLRESKQKTARSVRQMNRAARRSSLAIDRKVATPEELAQEMREDKEWGIRDALSNARDKLSGVDDNALVELAKSYLGDDITRDGLNRFLDGSMSDEELAGLGGQYGSLGDYQRAMLMQQTRQKRMREMSMNRRDRSLRRTMMGKGMSPEEQAQIATEDMEQQMRENLEQRMTTFGTNSPQFQRAIQSTLGEKATQEDAMAFLSGTATPEQMAAWGGDYAMLGNYGNYIQDRALMQREGAEMSLDQLMSEKRLMKMQQSPFANTWGMRMMMQGIQQAQKERNLNFRIRQARQQLRMLDGESLTGAGSAKPQPETAASAEARREAEKPKMSLGEAIANLPTEADDAYTGVVFKGKDASGLSKNQQAQLAVVDGFAKRVGVQVGIHDTLRAPDGGAINGMFDPTTNKIDLALDAEGNLITRTMGHEMMHYIRNNSEDDYKELMAFTKSTLQNTPGYDYEARVQEKLAQYNNGLPENQWITRDQAEEEIGAEAMIDMLNGKDVMNDLQKQKGSLGNTVSGRLGDYADALHETGASLNNPEAQAMAAQSAQTVDTLRAKFMQASMNASRKRQEAMGPNQKKRYSMKDTQKEIDPLRQLVATHGTSKRGFESILQSESLLTPSLAIKPAGGRSSQYETGFVFQFKPEYIDPRNNKNAYIMEGNAFTGGASVPNGEARMESAAEEYRKRIEKNGGTPRDLIASSNGRYVWAGRETKDLHKSFDWLRQHVDFMANEEGETKAINDYNDKIKSADAAVMEIAPFEELFPEDYVNPWIEGGHNAQETTDAAMLYLKRQHYAKKINKLTKRNDATAYTLYFLGDETQGKTKKERQEVYRKHGLLEQKGLMSRAFKNLTEKTRTRKLDQIISEANDRTNLYSSKWISAEDQEKINKIKQAKLKEEEAEEFRAKYKPYSEEKLAENTKIKDAIGAMYVRKDILDKNPQYQERADALGIPLFPFDQRKPGSTLRDIMLSEHTKNLRFSRRDNNPRDNEARKKQRPEWMNDKSNPYIRGQMVFAPRAVLNKQTSRYNINTEWRRWDEVSEAELENVKNRVALGWNEETNETGKFFEIKDPYEIAKKEAIVKAFGASKHAGDNAIQNAKQNMREKKNQIGQDLLNAGSDRERKFIAKRAISSLREEYASVARDLKEKKIDSFMPGKNAQLVDSKLETLKEEQARARKFEESDIVEAKRNAKEYADKRARKRVDIEDKEIPSSEYLDKKRVELDQRRQANENKLKAAQREINEKADTKIAQNKSDLETLQYGETAKREMEYDKRESAIKEATEKAMAEKRELLGSNHKEEAELRAENAAMQRRLGKGKFSSLKKQTSFKNEKERADAERLKQIDKRLEAIGRENQVLQDEMNPSSKAYEDVVTNLPEVKAAKQEYQAGVDKRKAKMSYLENQANVDAEKERKAALAKAEADYKKEKSDIDKSSAALGKSYDTHTARGKASKAKELDAFDAETKTKQEELDNIVRQLEEKHKANEAKREEELLALDMQRYYDPAKDKEGMYIVNKRLQALREQDYRGSIIRALEPIAKTGKMPQDEEEVAETTTAATGAVEQATNAVSALGDAAQQAAAKLNETAEGDDASGGDSSGGDSSGGDSSGGDEEPAPAPPSNPPTPPAPPSDTGAPDDPNYRTTRWGRRVQRRFHEDGTRYSDEEETRQDGRETRATAAAAFKDISKSAINMGSRAITNFGRSVFNSAINEAKNFVRQYDALMNEIQTITMKTGDEMSVIATETVQQALELKASVTDVATIKADLYRQGLSDDEVNERMEQVVQFSKVTGIKASESVQIVTTAMNTGLADSAQQAMDVLTALGDAAATTADQIQKGIQKAGSSAKVAGVSYEELATMMTIGTSKTQLSGQQIGTALQTIFARMNKVTQSNYISDLEGGTTSLNDVESALGIVGVKLRDDNGTFRSSFDVLRDLAGQWEGMNDTQKALVTNAFAGSRQSNIFQTLMEGMSEDGGSLMDEYLGLANNSEGTTQSKYEIAMQSLASSMEQVKTAWDGVVQAFVDNGAITGVLETITNFLTGIAKAVEDTQGKTEVAISVIVAALAGLTAAIAATTIAAATGATALAAFAGPIGWVVGIGGALAALSIIGSKYGQNYDSKVNNYEERATTRIEQTTKSQSETNKIISELKSLKDAYDKSDDKNSFESANSDKFNSLLIELNKCIPGVTDEFGNLTLSSENLAAALDKATAASEQKTEQDIKNMFGQGLAEAYTLMSEYFENRTNSTLGETYSAFGRAEDASKVEQTDYNEMIRTKFSAGTTEREGLLSQVKNGNYTEFNRMMQAYAKANGLSVLDPDDIWENIMTTVWNNADVGTLDFSNMTYEDANGNPVDVGEYVKQQIFKYVSDNLVVDQSGEDIIDSALDMFMAYVSSDMLPDGMKLDDVRSLALKMIQGNGQLYDNGEYNPQSMETSAFANLVLQNLFTPFTNNGTSGFGLLSQYDAQAGEKYAYTLNSENWGFDGTESVTRSDGSQVNSYYKNITDSEGNSHRLYFNRNNGGQEIFYKDEQENIHQITNTNNKEDIPQWLFDDGLVTVNEELATEANNNASETYTTLSAMGYNTKSEYDKGNGYLAMVQKGLRDNNENASFSTIEDFNAFMDETKVNDTLLSQVIGGAFDADKSGASLAAFNFASTDAGKEWMQSNPGYLTNTIMDASSTNGINTAGLEPLFNYLEGEGADRSFADLETDENYQDLMQNMKTQLGDDMYTQLANGDITVDQAREYLEGQWLENERSGYSDEQWDILQEKNGYDKEIAELEGKSSRTDEEETHLASLKEQSEDAQSRLSLLFTADQIRKTRKYGDATEDVADTLEKMTKRGAEAADQVSDLTSKMVTFRNQKWAIDKLSTGWDDEAGSALGLDENSYNYMKENNLLDGYLENMGKGIDTSAANYIVNPLIEAINAELASGNDNITADWVMELESSINNDGLIDSSEMASLISQCKNEQINKFIALAGNGKIAEMKITTRETEDGAGLYVTAEETGEVTSEKNKSGGGGGGGKSAAELLIDKQKKDKTLYEHMVKMVQYQQTKYQNADELGNYGLMIEKEIEVEKKRLPVIQQNIEKLKEQIATVAADSDDWYSLRDAILEAEEEYEEVNNTIDENIKKLEENQQAIYKLRTDLEDTVKEEIENRKQEETDMLSGSVSMQETILAAIKQRYQDEWDQEVHNPRIAGKP